MTECLKSCPFCGSEAELLCKMKIQDLLKQAKPCWKYAPMDKGKNWTLFERKPNLIKKRHRWERRNENHRMLNLSYVFDIEPFDGDWRDSLICR